MIKFTILLVRKRGLSHAEFVEHHKTVHADLFLSIPAVQQTVRRYVQQHAIEAELLGMPPTKYDGITELWSDDVESLARCFFDPNISAASVPTKNHFSICTPAISWFRPKMLWPHKATVNRSKSSDEMRWVNG